MDQTQLALLFAACAEMTEAIQIQADPGESSLLAPAQGQETPAMVVRFLLSLISKNSEKIPDLILEAVVWNLSIGKWKFYSKHL